MPVLHIIIHQVSTDTASSKSQGTLQFDTIGRSPDVSCLLTLAMS